MAEAGKSSCCVGSAAHDASAAVPARRPSARPAAMPPRFVRLEGGTFQMGTDERILAVDGECPARRVRVAPFAVDPHAVTNAWFEAFVAETGYVTEAERFGWSFVFAGLLPADFPATQGVGEAPWWRRVDGASWRHPEGPASTVETRRDHPVVHVSWNDANAFAAWAGARLPSEAEWEFAARGGLEGRRFPWGDDEPADGENLLCNIWQGRFPDRNVAADGHAGTAPVASFAPNGYGLFNMVGNAWEWCSDGFRVRSLKRDLKARDRAARLADSKVIKGGSYLCHRSYCYRYRIAARVGTPPDTSTGHTGFRVVYSSPHAQGA